MAGGRFVALGYNRNKAATSPDGITWTARTLASTNNWQAITYGNGQFVAITYLSTVAATSPDGITWTNHVLSPFAGYWQSVAFGNSMFVAISSEQSNKVTSSPDGITWTPGEMPASAIWQTITFGNGVFVAVAVNSSIAATSSDGITWTQRAMPVSTAWQSVTFGNGMFVAVSSSGAIAASSPDGITWTQRTLPAARYFVTVTAASGLFVAVAQSSGFGASSPDGITWTQITMSSSRAWYAVAYGGGHFAAVASDTEVANYYAFAEVASALQGRAEVASPLGAPSAQGAVLREVTSFGVATSRRSIAASALGASAVFGTPNSPYLQTGVASALVTLGLGAPMAFVYTPPVTSLAAGARGLCSTSFGDATALTAATTQGIGQTATVFGTPGNRRSQNAPGVEPTMTGGVGHAVVAAHAAGSRMANIGVPTARCSQPSAHAYRGTRWGLASVFRSNTFLATGGYVPARFGRPTASHLNAYPAAGFGGQAQLGTPTGTQWYRALHTPPSFRTGKPLLIRTPSC